MSEITIDNVRYFGVHNVSGSQSTKSIEVIGIDTEAYVSGRCFMLATSIGDFWHIKEYPQCLFSRKYRSKNYVSYNLKYDEGALIQFLPMTNIKELREEGRTEYAGYLVKCIPTKMLSISRTKHAITIYDMYTFFHGSLEYNAQKYLGMSKDDIETKTFLPHYVRKNWQRIGKYCIQDALLVQKLAEFLIKKFESYGVFPKKLYSTAYVAYQYFRENTEYVTVKRFWDRDKRLLDYAMRSYNGGKFEVTTKGCGYFYEYDIVSAYPYEIANLIDISNAVVIYDRKYRKNAAYGFLKCKIKTPPYYHNPVAWQDRGLNLYCVGEFEKVITKSEYEYMINTGCDITIIDAVWMIVHKRKYPYKKLINQLVKRKSRAKRDGDKLDYHTVKILMNSLYGKFVQLVKTKNYYRASSCWNPIYGAVITANTRIKISDMQRRFPSVIAVHTDSIISTEKLDFRDNGELGDMIYECEGNGVILGSGVYQIGDKTRLRGFNSSKSLLELIDRKGSVITMNSKRPYTWKEVCFHNWEKSCINRFTSMEKRIHINFDRKRIWLHDWKSYKEVLTRQVESVPRCLWNGKL